jgi:hypothetical protein
VKTKADKALEACKEYDRLMSAIKRNTEEIGEGLDVCSRWVDDESGRHFAGGDDTHLAEAFKDMSLRTTGVIQRNATTPKSKRLKLSATAKDA